MPKLPNTMKKVMERLNFSKRKYIPFTGGSAHDPFIQTINMHDNLGKDERNKHYQKQLKSHLLDSPLRDYYELHAEIQLLKEAYSKLDRAERNEYAAANQSRLDALLKKLDQIADKKYPDMLAIYGKDYVNEQKLYVQALIHANLKDARGSIPFRRPDESHPAELARLNEAKFQLVQLGESTRGYAGAALFQAGAIEIINGDSAMSYYLEGAQKGHHGCMAEVGQHYIREVKDLFASGKPLTTSAQEGEANIDMLIISANSGNAKAVSYLNQYLDDFKSAEKDIEKYRAVETNPEKLQILENAFGIMRNMNDNIQRNYQHKPEPDMPIPVSVTEVITQQLRQIETQYKAITSLPGKVAQVEAPPVKEAETPRPLSHARVSKQNKRVHKKPRAHTTGNPSKPKTHYSPQERKIAERMLKSFNEGHISTVSKEQQEGAEVIATKTRRKQ